jgi:type VI secretion system protein ImpE
MSQAQDLIATGQPREALAALQAEVRARPADVKLRIFLFQLLCVLGQWDRAATQLELCGEMDASTLAMVNTYREALKCERVRDAVFAGKTTPMVLGEPQEWVAWLIAALRADAEGDTAQAAHLRRQAFEAAPASAGHADDTEFDWIADADSRLGPVLEVIVNGRYGWLPFSSIRRLRIEPPEDLRDMVWTPVQIEFANGGDTVALVPTRYAPFNEQASESELMAHTTDWGELAPEQYAGHGQRIIATSARESPLLEWRDVVLTA